MSSDLEWMPDAHGVRLRVRVAAAASRTRVIGPHGGSLKIAVNAAPERGKANEAVLDLLAETFGLAGVRPEIVRGGASPSKVVLLPLGRDEAESRWRAVLAAREREAVPPGAPAAAGRRAR